MSLQSRQKLILLANSFLGGDGIPKRTEQRGGRGGFGKSRSCGWGGSAMLPPVEDVMDVDGGDGSGLLYIGFC